MTLRRGDGGRTLLELLQALAVFSLVCGVAAAGLAPAAGGRVAEAGARALAARLSGLAARAVAENRETALVFPAAASEPLREAADGGRDGVTRRGVESGGDPSGPPFTLASEAEGARIALPAWDSFPDPAGGAAVRRGDAAVRCGAARMFVFDPEGHATPGTVFVGDGGDSLCAVVVAGGGARVRVLCYDRAARCWRRR
ncbi:MAG TPA: hypothetical protein PKG80_01255 [Acidobacteriota bacterium]|nr:hypothetical protein [Acidobacteriota bacterium]